MIDIKCMVCGINKPSYHRFTRRWNDSIHYTLLWHDFKFCIFNNRTWKNNDNNEETVELLLKKNKIEDISIFVCNNEVCLSSVLILDEPQYSLRLKEML